MGNLFCFKIWIYLCSFVCYNVDLMGDIWKFIIVVFNKMGLYKFDGVVFIDVGKKIMDYK